MNKPYGYRYQGLAYTYYVCSRSYSTPETALNAALKAHPAVHIEVVYWPSKRDQERLNFDPWHYPGTVVLESIRRRSL